MSPSLEKLETLFEAAVALETEGQRAEYLDRACPDPALRREVETLLVCHQKPDRVFARDTIRVVPVDVSGSYRSGQCLGQILDAKYRLDRLLGQGGMGEVYLSTHLGTGRYVAVKLITPQYMRNPEFVERFKREARAAGRLRHPNIVDVTDFGVAQVDGEDVAYLVMEFLDGCTLSDVLVEEVRLPLPWVVDILEQVCSAVQEAHRRGIIHRDLKPANIWLEPNALGGYRVKVLDFGIAKLAEVSESVSALPRRAIPPPAALPARRVAPSATGSTSADGRTPINPAAVPAAGLTEVGSILGTPWYMSPEQCHGDALDARSDIYSLGIIAYQMVAGTTPFTGDGLVVLRAHQESQPKPLEDHVRKLPLPVSRVIMSALEKDPALRPQTAMAFAHALRANTENLGALYRRAFALYCEYFPQIITLSLLAHIPAILITLMMVGLRVADPWLGQGGQIALGIPIGLLRGAANFLAGSVVSGVIAIMVTQLAVMPLKPVTLRTAFAPLRGRWRPLLKTGLVGTLRIFLGYLLLVIPGIVMTVRYSLWAPVVLLEGLENRAALERSRRLAARSWRTVFATVLFLALLPIVIEWVITRLAGVGGGDKPSLAQNVASELITLSSVFFLPLVSIVMALVYLKMRQLAGEEMTQLMPRIEGSTVRAKWDRRIRTDVDSVV